MADYDVVIIGSGTAGALCAAGLVGSGRKILVLEAAKNGLGVAQRETYKRVWDPANPKSWNTPYLRNEGIHYYRSPGDSKNPYYDQPAFNPPQPLRIFQAYYQRLLGGASWAWRGNTPRMLPSDLVLKSKYFTTTSAPSGSSVVDWPVTYDDLKPWYLKAEQELGVAGNADEWESLTPRDGQPYPMPGQPKSYGDLRLIDRLQKKGKKTIKLGEEDLPVQIITMAQARNSRPYDGRPACEGNHNCIPLCPTNAKYDASIHLKRAYQNGVEIRPGCVVTKLKSAPGGLINSVVFKQWDSANPKQERSVSARFVILAANPIESPKILLASGLYAADHPYVGKNLMDHIQAECVGLTPEDDPIYPFRGPQTICGIDSIRDGKYRSSFASFRMTLGNDGWGRDGNPTSVLETKLNPTDSAGFTIGKKLREDVRNRLSRLVRFGVSAEQLPYTSNKVELSTQLDDLDIPRPKITYQLDAYTQEALRQGFRVSKELFTAMDVEVHENSFPVENWRTAAHPMGTCRMGTKPDDSVVNRYGKCHNHPNLFIVGASTFPTGSATNPMLTLAALTLMAVDNLNKNEL